MGPVVVLVTVGSWVFPMVFVPLGCTEGGVAAGGVKVVTVVVFTRNVPFLSLVASGSFGLNGISKLSGCLSVPNLYPTPAATVA